jgi:tetratricopeptide (TPR) repeat protein
LVLLLVAYASSTAVQARRIAAERDRANRERETAERASAFLANMLGTVKPDALGKALWKDLHQRVGAVHGDESGASDAAARALGDLDRSLAGVNPTQTALHLLDDQILDRAGKTIEHDMPSDPGLAGRLEHTLGATYVQLGLYRQAVQHFQRAVDLRSAALGPEDRDTLDSLRLLADVSTRLGRYADAEKLYSRVIEIRRRVRGPEHLETLNAMYGLASNLERQGRNEEARKLLLDLLEVEKRTLGPEHATTRKTSNELATVYWNEGKYDEAEALFLAGLEASRKTLGPENTDTLFAEVLRVSQRVLGPEHIETLQRMSNLASLYAEQGRNPEAEKLMLEALEGKRKVLGPEHPSTLFAMNALAEIYLKEGRYDEAERLLRQTLDARRRVLGPSHPNTLTTVATLALAHDGQRRYREADALAADAIAGYERAKLTGGEGMGIARLARGRALVGLGQYSRAEEDLLSAERLIAGGTPSHAEAVASLAELYTRWETAESGKGHAAQAARWKSTESRASP